MGITIFIIFVLAIAGAIVWFFNKKEESNIQPGKPSEPASQPSVPPVDEGLTEEPKEPEKPKFKVGDWIIYKDNIWKICNISLGAYYELLGVSGDVSIRHFEGVDKIAHLWAIQDAKDGDVLCCESGWTCIFKTLVNDETFSSYCFMDKTKWFCETGCECHTLKEEFMKAYNGKIYPANKEQRNILMKAMANAGYTFDFEKKELKKIEQQEPVVEEPEPITEESKSKLLYKVGLISDMHYDVADSKKSEYAEDITNALKYFKQQEVDFIASCGDFAQYDFKDFDGFYNLYKKNTPDIRLYTCLGNHDYLLMYDEHNTMSESDRQMAWQNTIADLHCRTDVKDRKSSEAENDIHFFEYDAPWDAPKGTGTRTIKSKLNYWIERHGDIYVFLSVDYGKDPIPQLWGTMANAVSLLDKNDKYVKQMKEYVKDTSYNEKLEGKFDYQFYHPNTMIWLKDIIEANKDKNVFVFTHHYLTHKAGGNTPSNGKWFYSQMRVWPYTSDERIRQRYYSVDIHISSGIILSTTNILHSVTRSLIS